MEILVDEPDQHAHIDRTDDCFVIAYDAELEGEQILRLINLAMDNGYYWITQDFHDLDSDRLVAIFHRERTPA